MIRLKKLGFTLVELLAVIVILAALALLTSTSIIKLLKGSKDDIYEVQVNLIIDAARAWANDNLNLLPDVDTCKYLTLDDLVNFGYLNSDIIDSRTNENMNDELKIKITSSNNKYNKIITDFEATDIVEGCTSVY